LPSWEARRILWDDLPLKRRQPPGGRHIGLRKAGRHNLRNLDVNFPVGCLTVVTGVSGSGKSTLVMELLREGLAGSLTNKSLRKRTVQGLKSITGAHHVNKLVVMDQSPIGRTPSSNPATYTKVFDAIREIFASTPESRMRGFKSGHFSFNTGDGRCPACRGRGEEVIEMHFLSDVTIRCDLCRGMRYNRETLAVTYKGMNISQVLDMEVSAAAEFFVNHRRIKRVLDLLNSVGLGYLKLGQQATTLSGGEAQRVKLAAELCRPGSGGTVYLLDEPTTGLHFSDVQRLTGVLHLLVDQGNTVVVVEHNLDVIKTADFLIDLGPEGGDAGGDLIAQGTPELVAGTRGSHTGKYLRMYLKKFCAKGVRAG